MPIIGILALAGVALWTAGGVTGWQANNLLSKSPVDPNTGQAKPSPIENAAHEVGKAAGNGLAIAAIVGVSYLIYLNETKRKTR